MTLKKQQLVASCSKLVRGKTSLPTLRVLIMSVFCIIRRTYYIFLDNFLSQEPVLYKKKVKTGDENL